MKKTFIIDGTGLVYRAYYAFIGRPLTNSKGKNISALFGYLKFLLMIIKEYNPNRIITAFDISRTTFRTELYKDYKANRKETPEDLKKQIPLIIEALKLINLPVIELENYEADDIIGTIANKLKNEEEITIISGDKDMAQLCDSNIKLLRPIKGLTEKKLLDYSQIKNEFGVNPEQIVDFIAITGDTSDNIPGVKGIGEKGAIKLLEEFGSLDNIYANIDKISGALKEKLIKYKNEAYLSKQLATIKTDLDLDISIYISEYKINNLKNENFINFLKEHEIFSLIKELEKLIKNNDLDEENHLFKETKEKSSINETENLFSMEEEYEEINGDYKVILTNNDLESMHKEIVDKKYISIDTETTDSFPYKAELISISISTDRGKGYFIPFKYKANQTFDNDLCYNIIKNIMEDENIKKIGQNIKFDIEVFLKLGIKSKGYIFDTMIAAHLLNPGDTRLNLERLCNIYLKSKKLEYSDIVLKGSNLLQTSLENIVKYSCQDSDTVYRLKEILEKKLIEENLLEYLTNIEIPLCYVLADMELRGALIDKEKLKSLSLEADKIITEKEKLIYKIAGKEFNINSTQQLSKILYEDLKLEPLKKTAHGKYSTDEETLTYLSQYHDLPRQLLEYRTFAKIKNTYIDTIPEMLDNNNRVHTTFNQTITATGRLSSSDPNLQNIPIKDNFGRRIREAFISPEKFKLISADYSQIELRVLAHFSNDPEMIKAFNNREDIHRYTASLIFKVKQEDVNEDMRRKAKSVNFGIIYGLQAYGLSRQLGISFTEAKDFINKYFETYPSVKNFINNTLQKASETGMVRTLFGRLRRFPELKNIKINPDKPGNSERMAINTVIQGTASEIMKKAMIDMYNFLNNNNLKSKIILQIHDELVIETYEDEIDIIKKNLKSIMENTVKLNVPLEVDINEGNNLAFN